jgi:GNAT superfamily N-acetyltransferase
VPPLTDVVGHLLSTGTHLRVRTKRGEVVEVAADDVIAIKTLSAAPLRTSQIRELEHAAALAWPGIEQHWLDGWLLRAGRGSTHRANSAVPIGISASLSGLSKIVEWYASRGLPARIAAPDRLVRIPSGVPVERENIVLACDLPIVTPESPSAPNVTLASRPGDEWLQLYDRDVDADVLTAVVDGDVAFATLPGAAVGRAAVTAAPNGVRWAGLSAVHVAAAQRRRGHARTMCTALLRWAATRGATRAYVQVLVDNVAATTLYETMGFMPHHRSRYVDARNL